jgi:hypothetical protein
LPRLRFALEADGKVQERPAAARVSRSKTPTANALARHECRKSRGGTDHRNAAATFMPSVAPRSQKSVATSSDEGTLTERSESQGAALAVGV